MAKAIVLVLILMMCPCAEAGSPVQKVIELLEDTTGKINRDMQASEAEMTEYANFCDDEATKKEYAIKTAARSIAELTASINEATAVVTELESEIASLGTEMASKDKEVNNATMVRHAEHNAFVDTEKEMAKSVDQLSMAAEELRKNLGSASFLQANGKRRPAPSRIEQLTKVSHALAAIVDAAWVTSANRRVLKGFLQQKSGAAEDDDLVLSQPQAKTEAYSSKSGGIVNTIEDMKEKAEESLTSTRQEETKSAHAFNMMEQGLQGELALLKQRKSDASIAKATSTEEKGRNEAELIETQKTKAADESYIATLKSDCQQAAKDYEVRQQDATAELTAIAKAKEILSGGVRVFVQIDANSKKDIGGDDEDSKMVSKRAALVSKLKALAHDYHSFAMMQMVTAASSDPFAKIRGLVEDMIAKLVAEANEEATQKAFCDEEIGKSKKSKEAKEMSLDKFKSRIDRAESAKATLTQSIKELEAEISEIDASTAVATRIRNEENAEYRISSKDFKDAAEATEQAIVVLKEYYEGASMLFQKKKDVKKKGSHHDASFVQSSEGASKSDAGHAIISILEMAAEDFTKTYTEIEEAEHKSQRDFEALANENKVSRAAKKQEARGKSSEVKSLTTALSNYQTDSGMVEKELDAVLAYTEKLKPQCESKVMSYTEKKARREAEIDGLKEALEILQ